MTIDQEFPGLTATTTPQQAAAQTAYVYGLACVAALAGLLFGFDTAVINGAIVFLKQQLRLTDAQTETAATSLLIGCMAGAAIAGFLADRFGRRRILLQSAVLFCVSSVWTALPNSLGQFVLARFVAGLAIGVASVVAPMYIAEIAPPHIRGILVTLYQMAIVTGILASYFINWLLAGLGPNSWRWMFATAAAPSLAFFIALLFIPESPRWLFRWNRAGGALAVLTRVSGPAEAEKQAEEIRSSLAEETGSWRELLEPRLRRPIAVAALLAVFSQITGINTVIYYGTLLLKEHGGFGKSSDAFGANVLIGFVNFAVTIAAIGLIDKIGRKPLLLCGVAGMTCALLGLSSAFSASPVPAARVLTLLLIYVGCFAFSLGPGTWVYISEIFPTAVRGRAMSIATLSLWLACAFVTWTFLSLIGWFGATGAFRIFAGICVVTFLFIFLALPETKGRTLEQIGRSWGGH
ncbi:MAG: sugar porter family MFS transporter [Bryobacteraceae bacterium]|nr:sugar porter family MFS transporter [Bryobacteraceae bacterium]